MLIECDNCAGRGRQCGDCVVTALGVPMHPQPEVEPQARFDRSERRAIDVLAWAGLLPRLEGRPDASSHERAEACLVSQTPEPGAGWPDTTNGVRRAG